MRVHIPFALPILLLAALFHAQQNPPARKKVLTPEQKAFQQQYQQWFTRHHQLQAQAKDIFDKETARAKAGDCPGASSNSEFIACFGKLSDAAEETLKSYEAIIHELLIPPPRMPAAPASGHTLASTQLNAEFDTVENTWRQYRENACTAAYHQFEGGTGGPSFQVECEVHLTRNHMRELDMIYGNVLHL